MIWYLYRVWYDMKIWYIYMIWRYDRIGCYTMAIWYDILIWYDDTIWCVNSQDQKFVDICDASSPLLTRFYLVFFVITNIYYKNRIVYSNSIKWSIDIICSFGSNIMVSGLNSRFKIILKHTCGPRTFGLDCTLRCNQLGFNFVFFGHYKY